MTHVGATPTLYFSHDYQHNKIVHHQESHTTTAITSTSVLYGMKDSIKRDCKCEKAILLRLVRKQYR